VHSSNSIHRFVRLDRILCGERKVLNFNRIRERENLVRKVKLCGLCNPHLELSGLHNDRTRGARSALKSKLAAHLCGKKNAECRVIGAM
jgi:hypothetical protein